MRIKILSFIILFSLLFSAFEEILAQGFQKKRDTGKYLIICSYNPDTKRMSDFISDFEKSISEVKEPYQIVIEDMGFKNFSTEAFTWTSEINAILGKYKDHNLKAIILLGQEAWSSFLGVKNIPENIPFFASYASLNGIELPKEIVTADWMPTSLNMSSKASRIGIGGGILTEYNIAKNIDLIRSFYPDVNNIVFVSDNTYGGLSLQSLVIKEMKKYPELGLTLIDGRKYNTDQSEIIVKNLPEKSVILLGTWRVNKGGINVVSTSLTKLIEANPKIPVFSLSSTGIGSVAIGGYIPRYGSNAKYIVNQIKNYEKGNIDSVKFATSGGVYEFDRRKLDELGIREDHLPSSDIVFVDSEDPRISTYQNYIIIISCISLLLVCLFTYMTVLWSKNRRLRCILELHGKDLLQAKEKAEESDRLKTAFLANMSHEIRTPLNAIVGFSDILSTENLKPEEKIKYNKLVSQNSDILLTLINDILDITRLETGNMKFTYDKIDINFLIRQVISTTQHLRKPSINYSFNPSRESLILTTDYKRLTQVFINLITNANKFTEKGSITIDYTVNAEKNIVLFSVTDTGVGIPKDKQKNVFRRFEKLDEYKQGTGLGLAICKQIITMLGGDIWIDSEYTNGARFYFFHPMELG